MSVLFEAKSDSCGAVGPGVAGGERPVVNLQPFALPWWPPDERQRPGRKLPARRESLPGFRGEVIELGRRRPPRQTTPPTVPEE